MAVKQSLKSSTSLLSPSVLQRSFYFSGEHCIISGPLKPFLYLPRRKEDNYRVSLICFKKRKRKKGEWAINSQDIRNRLIFSFSAYFYISARAQPGVPHFKTLFSFLFSFFFWGEWDSTMLNTLPLNKCWHLGGWIAFALLPVWLLSGLTRWLY